MSSARRLRIGIVGYLNSRPLAWGLGRGELAARYESVYAPPARVADLLAAGEIDVGLIPSIEYQRIPELAIVPGPCVASEGAVGSVLLISKVPFAEIRTLALDENSRTSATLVRILLAERYGVEPRARPAPADLDSMLAAADAALVIGDPALAIPIEPGRVLDLATAWRELTGLPFVFAFWAARPAAATPALARDLAASLAAGLASLARIAAAAGAELGLAPAAARAYFERNLTFELGGREMSGLEEFYRRARPWIARPEPLRFVAPAPAGELAR